jgi:hypothetical protein
MENPRVIEVFERLKQALKITSDKELSDALGLAYQAFSKRKLRGSMPQEEVETVIEQHGLNASWIYTGEGPMFEGGEAQERREQEWHELKEQLLSMSLHNQTRSTIEPLVKGIVWGDSSAVERWVDTISGLSQDERQIIAAYREGKQDVKTALMLIAQTGTTGGDRTTMNFNANVGQAIKGDVHAQSLVFHSSESPAVAKRRGPHK